MIAGVVIAQFGAGAAFVTAVFGMLAFSIGLQFVELNRHEQTGGKRKGLGSDILEGVTYVLRHTSIGPLLLLIMVSAIFSRSFLELFPGFADEVFDQGAEGLGILFSAVGGGGIVGAFWLANYGKTEGLMKVSLVTLFITAIALILFASTRCSGLPSFVPHLPGLLWRLRPMPPRSSFRIRLMGRSGDGL